MSRVIPMNRGALLRAMFALVSLAAALVMGPPPQPAAAAQNCLAWDRQWFGEAADSRPAIDRFPQDQSFGKTLAAWRADNCMRLNQIQVVGTHNSYHIEPAPPVMGLLQQFLGAARAATFDYTHRPIAEQLQDLQVRQLEFDVFADPAGGLFAAPLGGIVTGQVPPPLPGMTAAGLKVLHIQDVDYKTRCQTFILCLQQIKAWSNAHRGHLPIMILIEAKDDPLPLAIPPELGLPPAAVPLQFTAARLNAIDTEIRSVFDADRLMTPDDVRGPRATLEEAILKDGWPTLNELRGRVFFALDNTDAKRDDYIAGHPSLAGRVMFVSASPGSPEAAFVKMNNPDADFATIQELVSKGYIVRTMADAETIEARDNLTARRDAALSSGAQFVSTDYPEVDSSLVPPTPYFVDIPGVARCNPVLSPPTCDASMLER